MKKKPLIAKQTDKESYVKFFRRIRLPKDYVLSFKPRNAVDWDLAEDKIKDMKYTPPLHLCGDTVNELMDSYFSVKDVIQIKNYVDDTNIFELIEKKSGGDAHAFLNYENTLELLELLDKAQKETNNK